MNESGIKLASQPAAVRRFAAFVAVTIAAGLMAFFPIEALMTSVARSDYYSHIVLIPLVSAYFLWFARERVFGEPEPAPAPGIAVAVAGLALYALGLAGVFGLNENDHGSLLTFASIVFWLGGFMALYGTCIWKKEPFPLIFLVFAIPIPSPILNNIIYFLQVWSTEAVAVLFNLLDVPATRDGFYFYLPSVAIQVAKECSGIRSSLALFITGVVAGHLFLDKGWKTWVVVAAVVPITVVKNAIRIVVLTLLAAHVDPRFLTGGFLHQSGGFLFYIPALLLLGVVLFGLRRVGGSRRNS